MGQQISYVTVIVVHSTMHLMQPWRDNHCQITTSYIYIDKINVHYIVLYIVVYSYIVVTV